MAKLLMCLACAVAVGVAMLQLRQQELALKHQATRLQEQIEGQQARLWSQQLQITLHTAPNVMAHTVAQHELELVPEGDLPEGAGDWVMPKSTDKPH